MHYLILAYDKSQSFLYYLVTLDVKHIVIDEWDVDHIVRDKLTYAMT